MQTENSYFNFQTHMIVVAFLTIQVHQGANNVFFVYWRVIQSIPVIQIFVVNMLYHTPALIHINQFCCLINFTI